MKTYIFPVSMKEDQGKWHVYVPDLDHRGAATWGHSKEEALRNIQEVVQMVAEEMLEDGEPLPESVTISDDTAVAISV